MNTELILQSLNPKGGSKSVQYDDEQFVRKELKRFPKPYRDQIMAEYVAQWRDGKSGKEYEQQNNGRRQANTWLRELTLPHESA